MSYIHNSFFLIAFEELFSNWRISDSDYNSGSDSMSATKSESDSDSDVGKKSVKSKTHSCVVEKPQLSGKW